MAVTEANEVDYFTHRPYEKLWNITHEDLAPMLFEATVRGRLEQGANGRPVLVLKAPQNVREYFEFKEVPEARSQRRHPRADGPRRVHPDRAPPRSGRGWTPGPTVHLTDLGKFFPDRPDLVASEPFCPRGPRRRGPQQRVNARRAGREARPGGVRRPAYFLMPAISSSIAVVTDFGRSIG